MINLQNCNETELLQMAREQGLGILKRGIHKDILIAVITKQQNVDPSMLSETVDTRKRLETLIQGNWEKIRSQLPGCDGKCTTYPCSEGRHAACFWPNKDLV